MALAEHAEAAAGYLAGPAQACGMASHNLACAYTAAGRLDSAAAAVETAVALNADFRANAARAADLAAIRDSGLRATTGHGDR